MVHGSHARGARAAEYAEHAVRARDHVANCVVERVQVGPAAISAAQQQGGLEQLVALLEFEFAAANGTGVDTQELVHAAYQIQILFTFHLRCERSGQ